MVAPHALLSRLVSAKFGPGLRGQPRTPKVWCGWEKLKWCARHGRIFSSAFIRLRFASAPAAFEGQPFFRCLAPLSDADGGAAKKYATVLLKHGLASEAKAVYANIAESSSQGEADPQQGTDA